ncbi:calmodulin [Brachionus plicatilis]|uniref:Calmodulin n=1 Tax=Brachionus plicatilis TaxID=10195 RepID=A0A3M7RQ98_BRAPC|nr:calmodulin [Brachionus plicatilis]
MDKKDIEDGDGRISWEELGYVMKTLGHRVSENQLKEIMKLIDENGNGVIDFDEFTDMLDKTKSIADPEADLKEAFKVFDLDGDGVITAKELKLVMHSLGQPVSGSDIDDMIKEADQNSDGKVDFGDFVAMMSRK